MGKCTNMTYLKRIVLYIMNVAIRLGEERWKNKVTISSITPEIFALFLRKICILIIFIINCKYLLLFVYKKMSSRFSERVESICEFVA
jgi:hypothetical protein